MCVASRAGSESCFCHTGRKYTPRRRHGFGSARFSACRQRSSTTRLRSPAEIDGGRGGSRLSPSGPPPPTPRLFPPPPPRRKLPPKPSHPPTPFFPAPPPPPRIAQPQTT